MMRNMNNMNNMNMMGMNMGMPNMNMMGMNMGMPNMNMDKMLDNEDKDGWELTFKYDDGKDKKEVVIKISCDKTVNEAISKYKLKVANTEDMKFEYPPNKELNRTLKISQSGLSNKSVILVKPREDKSKKEEEIKKSEEVKEEEKEEEKEEGKEEEKKKKKKKNKKRYKKS